MKVPLSVPLKVMCYYGGDNISLMDLSETQSNASQKLKLTPLRK